MENDPEAPGSRAKRASHEELGVHLIPVDRSSGMSRSTESSGGGGALCGDRLETARHVKKA